MIEFNQINFGYEKNLPILKDVSFTINEGEYICVVGHNGCGKSTISKILIGLLKPWSGEIKLFGQAINQSNYHLLRENIGVVFQNPENQFVGLTVEDDIAFGLENKQIDPLEMKKIIVEVAKMLKIDKLLKLGPQNLSGGEKQKVAIASILAMAPKIIVFDEATAMLDPKSKSEIKNLMLELKQKYHKTIISITHDMDEASKADKILLMNKGQVQHFASPFDVFQKVDQIKDAALDQPFILKLSIELNKINTHIIPTLSSKQLIKNIVDLKKQ
ncbi:energy-coupling factor transporter ATPase [bacterium]|nr:energy-coupling factor transporter ATPase [bacterium]